MSKLNEQINKYLKTRGFLSNGPEGSYYKSFLDAYGEDTPIFLEFYFMDDKIVIYFDYMTDDTKSDIVIDNNIKSFKKGLDQLLLPCILGRFYESSKELNKILKSGDIDMSQYNKDVLKKVKKYIKLC
jgi:hypothetical protein